MCKSSLEYSEVAGLELYLGYLQRARRIPEDQKEIMISMIKDRITYLRNK